MQDPWDIPAHDQGNTWRPTVWTFGFVNFVIPLLFDWFSLNFGQIFTSLIVSGQGQGNIWRSTVFCSKGHICPLDCLLVLLSLNGLLASTPASINTYWQHNRSIKFIYSYDIHFLDALFPKLGLFCEIISNDARVYRAFIFGLYPY